MKERMDRLTLKGKIVGYAWFCVCGIFYYRGQYDGYGTDIPKPEFDDWDMGIEVKDDWWFENDMAERVTGVEIWKCKGILTYREAAAVWSVDQGNKYGTKNCYRQFNPKEYEWKRIGNIYAEGEMI